MTPAAGEEEVQRGGGMGGVLAALGRVERGGGRASGVVHPRRLALGLDLGRVEPISEAGLLDQLGGDQGRDEGAEVFGVTGRDRDNLPSGSNLIVGEGEKRAGKPNRCLRT